jgi:RNA polymerase sigma factor (sigma-70 family)
MGSQSNHPWQDDNGRMLSDESLMTQTQGWKQETWDDYLTSLESPLRETLISDPACIHKLNNQSGSFFELSQCSCSRALSTKVGRALEHLSGRQRQVLQMTFWKNLSERDIANLLEISRSTVQVMKKRAIKRLELILKEDRKSITIESKPSINLKEVLNQTAS